MFSKNFAFAALLMLLSAMGRAQVTVKGQLTDAHVASTVSNATISLHSGQSAISDEYGNFIFRSLKPGVYRVSVTRIGYKPFEGEFNTGNPNWQIGWKELTA
jgi:hypothetical protein